MAAGVFSPDGANAVLSRPLAKDPSGSTLWFQDASAPGSGNGTVITASFLNQLVANLRTLIEDYGGLNDGSDEMLKSALEAGLLTVAIYDPLGVADDAFALENMAEGDDAKVMTAAERVKVGYLTVTGAVDLDAMDYRVSQLTSAVVLSGTWDASTGVFPGDGNAQPGYSYIVNGAGTVDGIEFAINDRIVALAIDASTSTYADNWHKLDYTDTPEVTFPLPAFGNAIYGGL